jgi:hypothetical protein
MNPFEQLVTDVPGRAVRLLVVASACTALVAVLSGMSHKWDDAPTKTVADPVFAKMAPVPERGKAKTFTDPAPVDPDASGPAARMTLATPAAAAPAAMPVERTAALSAPVEAPPAPLVGEAGSDGGTVGDGQAGGDGADLDETASIPPELPQPRPQSAKNEAAKNEAAKNEAGKNEQPDAEPLTLKVPSSVRVRSGSTFTIGSASYRLKDVDSIAPDSCKRGSRGCKRHPMRTLRQAIAGATLKCSASTSGSSTILSECSKIKAGGRSRRASGKRTRVARR